MLEREVWARLPMVVGGLPSVVEALEGARGEAAAAAFDVHDFGAWIAHGNPWKDNHGMRFCNVPTAEWCFFVQFVARDTRIATLQALVPVHATFGQTAVSDFFSSTS